MKYVEITQDLLEIIKQRAVAYEESKASPSRMLDYNHKHYLIATKPAVVLPLVAEVERLQQANKAMIKRVELLESENEKLECAACNCTCKRHPMEGAR